MDVCKPEKPYEEMDDQELAREAEKISNTISGKHFCRQPYKKMDDEKLARKSRGYWQSRDKPGWAGKPSINVDPFIGYCRRVYSPEGRKPQQ